MSEQPSAENDAHAPTLYNGRAVCTCGDFNCASLDAEKDAEAAWIEYRNGVQMRTPWENHRRAMRRLRKRDFIAGYLAATRVFPPG